LEKVKKYLPIENASSFRPEKENEDEKQEDIGDERQEIVPGSLEQVPQRRRRYE